MIIHTVLLCLFLEFTSNKNILSQCGAAVKWLLVKFDNEPKRIK